MILAILFAMALHDTSVDEPAFKAVLPGVWQSVSSNDALVFSQRDDLVYLTTLEPKEPQSRADRERIAFRIADMRAKLIGDLSRGKATLTPISKESNGARTMDSFGGEDPQNGKRVYVAVVAFERIVVTVAAYRPLSADAAGFAETARTIALSVSAK